MTSDATQLSNDEVQKLYQRIAELEEQLALVSMHQRNTITDSQAATNILAISSEAIISIDEEYRITYFNRGSEMTFGYTSDEILGKSIDILLPNEYHHSHNQHISQFAQSGVVSRLMGERMQVLGRKKDGTVFPAEASILQIEVNSQKQFTAFLRDITPRKQMEEALFQLQQFNAAVLESLTAHIAILHSTGYIVMVNRAWSEFATDNGFGDSEAAVGMNYLTICDTATGEGAEMAALAAQGIRDVIQGERPEYKLEYPCHSPDEKRWFMMRATSFEVNDDITWVVVAHENVTAHKKLELSLSFQTERLTTIFNSIPIMLSFYDQDEQIQIVNSEWQNVFGWSLEDIKNNPNFLEEIYPDVAQCEIVRANMSLADGSWNDYISTARDGHLVHTSWANIRLSDGSRIAIGQDVTERKAAQNQIEKFNRELMALHDASAAVTSSLDLQIVLNTLSERIIQLFDVERCSILDWDEQANRLREVSRNGPTDWMAELQFTPEYPVTEQSVSWQLLVERKSFQLTSDQADINPSARAFMESAGYACQVLVPMVYQDRVIGVAAIYDTRKNIRLNEQEMSLFQLLANQAASAIQNARNYETISSTAKELQDLYSAMSFLFEADNLESLCHQIAKGVVTNLHTVDCGVLLLEKDSKAVIRMARAGDYVVNSQASLNINSTGLVPAAIRDKTRIYVTDVTKDPRYVANEHNTRSELVIPLITNNAVIGVLDLQSPELEGFKAREQRLIAFFAERAALAIENMQLLETAQQQAVILEQRVAERTNELRVAKEYVELILRTSGDAIVVVDADGEIYRANPAFLDLLGYSLNEVMQFRQLSRFVEVNGGDSILAAIREQVDLEDTTRRLEASAHHKNGQTIHTEIVLSTIWGGQPKQVVCILHDISRHKQIEDSLRRSLKAEREISELKSEFITMVSHEFRTPLAIIQAAIDALYKYFEQMTSDQKGRRFDKIRRQIRHLTLLMDDVLMVGGMDSDTIEFHPKLLDLRKFIESIVEEFSTTEHKASLIVSCQGCDHSQLYADEKLLRQIVTNLISNAIKYSPHETDIEVELVCEPQHVVLQVSDNGIGIPEDDLPKLFTSFYRASNTENISGTGLGLVIVKQAVEMHDGSITVDSTINAGSIFTIKLPRNMSNEATNITTEH